MSVFKLTPRDDAMYGVFYDGQNVLEVDRFLADISNDAPTAWCMESPPHLLIQVEDGFYPVLSPGSWIVWSPNKHMAMCVPHGAVMGFFTATAEEGPGLPV